MKNIVISGFFLLTTLTTQAQISNFSDFSGKPLMITKYDKIEGSPYLMNGRWGTGSLVTERGTTLDNLTLRFNAFENEFEIQRPDGTVIILEKSNYKEFYLFMKDESGTQLKYLFGKGFPATEGKDYFFRVLYNSPKFQVLEKVGAAKIKVTPASYGEAAVDRFVPKIETYIVVDGKMIKQKVTVKNLASYFPQKTDAKDYVRQNRIDLDLEADLIRFCDYLIQ